MIESQGSGRARPYTYPEVLRAVGHALTRPGKTLTQPEVIRRCKPIHADQPAAELELKDGKLASITGWADAMNPVDAVTVIGGSTESVYLMVTGRLGNGPFVTVVNWVDDMPLEIRVFGGQKITMPELVALSIGTIDLSVPAMVGAR